MNPPSAAAAVIAETLVCSAGEHRHLAIRASVVGMSVPASPSAAKRSVPKPTRSVTSFFDRTVYLAPIARLRFARSRRTHETFVPTRSRKITQRLYPTPPSATPPATYTGETPLSLSETLVSLADTPPVFDPSLLPSAAASLTGIVVAVTAQVELLRVQPNYNAAVGLQFGIVPSPAHSPDLASLDSAPEGHFTGGSVELRFRSPAETAGVDMAEILCDRGNGKIERVGNATHARFTDHHPLPPDDVRATWVYYVSFLDRERRHVGRQGSCVVSVVGSASRA